MKKFIKSIILFIFFSSIVYCFCIIIWGLSLPNYMHKNMRVNNGKRGFLGLKLKEAAKVKNVDILFLGSSHAYRSFDPRIFKKESIKTFNLGSSSQSHLQTEVLLKKYLDSLNPKLIIYDVYLGIFLIDGVESSLDLLSNGVIDKNSLQMILKTNNIKLYNTFIYSNFLEIFKIGMYNKSISLYDDKYIEGGYVEKKIKYYKPSRENVLNWEINKKQYEAFIRNVEYIKSKKIKIIFIQTPITKKLYQSFSKKEKFDNLIENVGIYYNFNKETALIDTLDFYDSNHLNIIGVNKFNNSFLTLIKEKKYLNK